LSPSLSIWHRLEPHMGDPELTAGLEAAVRDPAWLLARQWQVGEFRGSDGGSPVKAQIRTESVPLTSYRPGPTGAGRPLDPALPVEVHAEREDAVLGLRGAVQLGLQFEHMLRTATPSLAAHIPAFRTAYSISPTVATSESPDVVSERFRMVAAGRVTDGAELYRRARSTSNLSALPPLPSISGTDRQRLTELISVFVKFRRGLLSEATGDSAWISDQLEFDFSVGSETDAGNLALRAPGFGGGDLDWYSFSGSPQPISTTASASATVSDRAFVPTNVTFHGAPTPRWWSFEDSQTDFGRLEVEKVELAKLVVMEFGLVYSDDWFELPLPLPVGSLTRVRMLLVTDTFGERTVIRETSEQVPSGDRPWSMFELSGDESARGRLLLAPRLVSVLESRDLEEVLFVRDEMAALAWGIERTIQGTLGAPVDGYESYRRRLEQDPEPPPRQRTSGGPAIEYRVGTTVPDNWIPLVPVTTSDRPFVFRRGLMQRPTAIGALVDVPARGRILEPEHPYYVADEAVPREGARVNRYVRRVRLEDGSTVTWFTRRRRMGRGEAASGLAFDTVEELPEPPGGP
jgi:hypothetical protein